MSTIKFDIQKFGGGDQKNWSAGVTESAIRDAYTRFSNQIKEAEDVINDIKAVREALEAGWSGQDREDFLAKYEQHAQNVIAQIEEYNVAVGKEVDSIIQQWTDFQSNLIS